MFWPSRSFRPGPHPRSQNLGWPFLITHPKNMFFRFWTLEATLFPPLSTHFALGFLDLFCPLTPSWGTLLRSACPPQHALAHCCALSCLLGAVVPFVAAWPLWAMLGGA